MAKEQTYPVGSKVKIKSPGGKPDGWNEDMIPLIGEMALIERCHDDRLPDRYIYRLNRWEWSWRHCDLELLEAGKLNPNEAFRYRKHAIR